MAIRWLVTARESLLGMVVREVGREVNVEGVNELRRGHYSLRKNLFSTYSFRIQLELSSCQQCEIGVSSIFFPLCKPNVPILFIKKTATPPCLCSILCHRESVQKHVVYFHIMFYSIGVLIHPCIKTIQFGYCTVVLS